MALQLLAANNAQSVLAAGISASATSLTLNTGTGALFPSPVSGTSFFKLTLVDAATGQLSEIVHVTAKSGDVLTIARGQEGTSARAWSANDIAANMMTAGTLSYILGNFQPLDPTLTALAALVGVANKLPYFNGDDTAALTDLTQVGRDIIGKSTILDILKYLSIDRIEQRSGETVIFSDNNKDKYLTSRSDNLWGYYNSTLNRFIPLSLSAGGTGVSSIAELKTALGLKSGAYGEVRTGSVTGTGNKTFSTPFPQGIVSGIAFCAVTSTGYMYSASVGSVSGSGFSFKPVYFSGGGNPIQAADGELFYYIAWGA
ncbi:hypothetical protein [Escherichia coli]|uniref:hypothetical protein n=1 Tax=Escherichia coli TaxID=562 RepID=UPI0010D107F5|nr:hypothetical protein [Escherichia coli]GCP61557.1 phage tail fiber protein [Escherichia coli]